MSEEDLGQSVRFREFVTSRDEMRARLHAIELEQARISASLMHLPSRVEEMTKALQELSSKVSSRPAQPVEADHMALSLHRALDALPKTNAVGGFERVLLLALTAFGSFMAARFFLG
jgi:predicted nuclease with TOPRIM domain